MEPSVRTKVMVRDVMNSPVITASPDEPIREVARKMREARVGSVVITEGEQPLGIVTEGDIVAKVVAVRRNNPAELKAAEVMSRPLHTIDSERDLTEAARTMRRLGVKRLGVTYKGRLVGMISVSDLIAVTPELIDILSEKGRISAGEMVRVRGYVSGYCDQCNQWSDYLMEIDGRFLCEDCRGETPREE
jgi:CBS domain-containing protein